MSPFCRAGWATRAIANSAVGKVTKQSDTGFLVSGVPAGRYAATETSKREDEHSAGIHLDNCGGARLSLVASGAGGPDVCFQGPQRFA